jgi:small subunit ribosomal protein S16
MSVKIRLARYGAKKKPFYRVVASDSRFARDGRFLEILGTYDPRNKLNGLNLNLEKIRDWTSRGAEFTTTVDKLVKLSERKENPSE